MCHDVAVYSEKVCDESKSRKGDRGKFEHNISVMIGNNKLYVIVSETAGALHSSAALSCYESMYSSQLFLTMPGQVLLKP